MGVDKVEMDDRFAQSQDGPSHLFVRDHCRVNAPGVSFLRRDRNDHFNGKFGHQLVYGRETPDDGYIRWGNRWCGFRHDRTRKRGILRNWGHRRDLYLQSVKME
ncbi:hypothetical protein D3C74_355430 [compost metagenome]